MKRIIEGKVYDTTTAELIATADLLYYSSDFRFEDTSLYLTKKGSYFIAGEGGPLSEWSVSKNGGNSGGSGIKIKTMAEALEWAEKNNISAEIIESYFLISEG